MSAISPHPEKLSVLVADEEPEPVAAASRAVERAGHRVVARVTTTNEMSAALELVRLDAAVVVVHDDPAHALDLVRELTAADRFPVLVVDTPAALERGLALAGRRDAEVGSLARQIRELEEGAARRASIEQAKGVVMERHGIDERSAYELLRHQARTARVPVAQIARSVLEARALF